jgi:putative aldouronate transport system permease protein
MSKNKSITIKEGSNIATAIIYLISFIIALTTVYPMYYVIILSISKPIDVAARTVFFLPTGFITSAYKYVLKDKALWISFRNSINYVFLTTGIKLILCSIAAYPLAMPRLAGRKYIVWYLLVPLYFSGGMIPSFLNMARLGLYNTIWSIILPSTIAIWHIVLIRTYFASSIPYTLRESAMVDGINHCRTLFHIYLPLSKPIMAVIAIYTIVGVWNSWFSASIYLTDPAKHPLQLYLKKMLVDNTPISDSMLEDEVLEIIAQRMIKMQLQYAVIVITTLPVLIVYPFLQKYFVKGIMVGSLKG